MKKTLALLLVLFSSLADAQQPPQPPMPNRPPFSNGPPPVGVSTEAIDRRVMMQMQTKIMDLQKQIDELKAAVAAHH